MNTAGMLCRILKSNYGIVKRSIMQLYTGLLVPCAMYGACVWAESMRYAYAQAAIQRCQRVAFSATMRLCRTVSTEAMQLLQGGLPWDLLCETHRIAFKVHKGLPLTEGDHLIDADIANPAWKSLLEENLMDKWQTRWDASTKGRTTYEWLPKVRFARDHPTSRPCLKVNRPGTQQYRTMSLSTSCVEG